MADRRRGSALHIVFELQYAPCQKGDQKDDGQNEKHVHWELLRSSVVSVLLRCQLAPRELIEPVPVARFRGSICGRMAKDASF
jgi:hypothetical protein